MKHPTLTLVVGLILAQANAFANTAREARLIQDALTRFQTENPKLLTLDRQACELKIDAVIRSDDRSYALRARLSIVGIPPFDFEISGPRITGVFQTFEVAKTPGPFRATVTNSDSDGHGYWRKDMRELKIDREMISLNIRDFENASTRTIQCRGRR